MAKFDLDRAFAAFSDANRRDMIARLARGPATVSELAAAADMTLPSCMAHLAKLEAAGLIESTKAGRTRTCHLRAEGMAPARNWLNAQETLWRDRLDQFDAFATTLHERRKDDPQP